jgi:hypothetical protein
MAAAFAAAILAIRLEARAGWRTDIPEHLLFAVRWIFYSFVMTRLWRMGLPQFTAGYAVIDLALAYVFVQRWQTHRHGAILWPLMMIQITFLAVHVGGSLVDFSGLMFGAERSHRWVEGFIRNRLFEASNLYVLIMSAGLAAIAGSEKARNLFRKLTRAYLFSKFKIAHLLLNRQAASVNLKK